MEKKLKIIHETSYTFEAAVFIEPHYLRFKPRITPYNDLCSFHLQISPTPIGLSLQSDQENNMVHFFWFDEMCEHLHIRSESVVILKENNPFEFILFPGVYFDLPFQYSPRLQVLLQPALTGSDIGDPLIAYGNNILVGSAYRTLNFITNLTHLIHIDFTLESRLEGKPFNPDKTFYLKKGSCNDLSWMQIQLLRHMGIAAKFVSGYYYMDIEDSLLELHGWLEVYLPGAGWVGFDPSHGIITGNNHIPVCSSVQYENTMPVTGSFSGSSKSTLNTTLSIRTVPEQLVLPISNHKYRELTNSAAN